jgi:hypothetical protein
MLDQLKLILNAKGIYNFISFPYGSRVYGTQRKDSDADYLIIYETALTGQEEMIFSTSPFLNLHYFSNKDWQNHLNEHKIYAIESYFLDKNHEFVFNLDKTKLRHEFSQKASNSWVKAKKKLTVEKDWMIGWKSLFHSLRILNFGKQIAEFGEIKDFSSENDTWKKILEMQCYDWEILNKEFKSIYNEKATEFRKVAPLNAN